MNAVWVGSGRPVVVSSCPMTDESRKVGPYTITREIRRGGMGVVYLARDTKLGREVAISALPPEVVDDAERLSRHER